MQDFKATPFNFKRTRAEIIKLIDDYNDYVEAQTLALQKAMELHYEDPEMLVMYQQQLTALGELYTIAEYEINAIVFDVYLQSLGKVSPLSFVVILQVLEELKRKPK